MKRILLTVLFLGLGALPASGGDIQCHPVPQPKPQPGGQFGCSVDLHKGTLAVGAHLDGAGSVTLCPQGATETADCQKISPADGHPGDEFGRSVAVDENWVIVGAPFANGSGTVYVYNRDFTLNQKLTASDGSRGDQFGATLALSNRDTLIVGALNNAGTTGSLSGAVYVFHWDGHTWAQGQKLTASDARPFDNFGFSLAIDGNVAVIGAPFHEGAGANSGEAYVFEWNGKTWSQTARLTASDAAAGAEYGSAVAVSGSYLAVGARAADMNGMQDAGSAYVYERSDLHLPVAHFFGQAAGDRFGVAVSMDGDQLLIGALLHNGNDHPESGAAYFYQRQSGTWVQNGAPILGDATGDRFGQAVSIDGNNLLVGAYLANAGAGSATVCSSPPPPSTADLALLKSAPASTGPGQTITYTLTVTNHGPDKATGVHLEDPIPAGLQPVPRLIPKYCMITDGKIVCELPDLLFGQKSQPVPLGFTVLAACGGTVVNIATVSAAPPAADPVSGNDSATVTTAIATDLSITKKADRDIAEPGQTLRYTIEVGNPDGCRATVKDLFPAALTNAKWCREEGGACTPSTPGNLSDVVTGPAAYDVQGIVSPAFTGTLVNTATVDGSSGVVDADLSNNSATYPTEIFVASRGIPTLTEPWLATLALLLALLALRRLRRRTL